MASTCKVPNPLMTAILDIVRPLRCDVGVDSCGDSTRQKDVPCGKETVICPCCRMDSGVCANHLMLDEEYHPQFSGVCSDCWCNPDACPEVQ
jgi:hypothetical protein